MVPDSRSYVHLTCRKQTVVEGPEFAALTDPLIGMQQTYCAACEQMFPVNQFAWADTQERLSDFYARYAQRASPRQRQLGSRGALLALMGLGAACGLLFGLLVGLAMGWIAGTILAIVAAIAGAIGGFFIVENLIKPGIYKSAFGVSDTRQLK